jgi:PAS domain S-box-containing protein
MTLPAGCIITPLVLRTCLSMSPLTIILVALGAISLTIGLLHLGVSSRGRASRGRLWFALAAFLAAANAWAEIGAYRAQTPGEMNAAFRWSIGFQGFCWIAFVWFLVHYAGTVRRWLALLVTGGFAVALAVHFLSPWGLLFREITRVESRRLPWGEAFSLPIGPPSPWRLVSDVTILLLIVLVMDTWLRLYRDRERHRMTTLGIASVALLTALVHGSLVDLQIVQTPYLMSLGFLAVVIVMGVDLARESLSAAELSREVGSQQRRWREFLDGAQLLVVGVDGEDQVNYVNPAFCDTTGFRREEVMGHRFSSFLAPGAGTAGSGMNHAASVRGAHALTEVPLVMRGGGRRLVLWSNVTLHGHEGESNESLSVGLDVTDQRRAEATRDRALAELRALKSKLEEENLYLKEEIRLETDSKEIIGESNAIRYVLRRVREVADTDTTVLIEGETGVGKELVARALHKASSRASRKFVKVNCAALPATLIESELFGHEAGAFTGALGLRKGRFELADTGTIFLDEIGELPLEVQVKLLRVVQEGELERVGGSKTHRVDVRIIAATNRNLSAEVEAGRFREDLFYRLAVYPITVPPLRERVEDIPLLVRYFLPRIGARVGRNIQEVPGPVLRWLRDYAWPGNVRELQNVLERTVLASSDGVLRLPESLTPDRHRMHRSPEDPSEELLTLAELERKHIQAALERAGGRISGKGGAAAILDLHPNTLRSRMKKLGIATNRTTREPSVERLGA